MKNKIFQHKPRINTMKIPQIISNPPDWLAVIFCLIGASVYLVTLIALKNLLH